MTGNRTGNREGLGTPPPPKGLPPVTHLWGQEWTENGTGAGNWIATGNGKGMGWDWGPPPSQVLWCPNLLGHIRTLAHALLQQDLEHFLQEFLSSNDVQAGIVQWDAVASPRALSHGRRTRGDLEMRQEGPWAWAWQKVMGWGIPGRASSWNEVLLG